MLGKVLRTISYAVSAASALAMLALGLVARLSGNNNLQTTVLPWTGETLSNALVCLGLLGLATTILAILGHFRAIYFLWTLMAFVLTIRWFFFTPYEFDGTDGLRSAGYLIAAMLIAAIGGYSAWRNARA